MFNELRYNEEDEPYYGAYLDEPDGKPVEPPEELPSIYFDLDKVAKSKEAEYLLDLLLEEVMPALGKRPRMASLKTACGAILASLFQAASGEYPYGNRYAYRPMNKVEFNGQPIGYQAFTRVLNALIAHGYVEKISGSCPVHPTKDNPRTCARYKASSKLHCTSIGNGLVPLYWRDHFAYRARPAAVLNPIRLKAGAKKRSIGLHKVEKLAAQPMRVDAACPKVVALGKDVNALNAYLSKHDIQPEAMFRGLHRIFSDGDLASPYGWNKGGRLYALSGGYQNMLSKQDFKKPDKPFRGMMRIDGHEIAEVDLKGSHLRLLYAWKEMDLSPDDDPYHVPGIPRQVVKLWVTMTLGYDKFHSRWTKDAKEYYAENSDPKGRSLQQDFPFKEIQKLILRHMPVFSDWPSSPWRWGDFQYRESCILMDAMKDLCLGQNVPALPLHDSLIVPVHYVEQTKRALSDAFYHHTGAVPGISVK